MYTRGEDDITLVSLLQSTVLRHPCRIAAVCRSPPTATDGSGHDQWEAIRSRVRSPNADGSLPLECRTFRRAVAVVPRDRGETRLVSVSLDSGPKNETENRSRGKRPRTERHAATGVTSAGIETACERVN
ncbi:hypothetical protein NJ7G_1398 [Natrinema sp. J7-2]|nr:hypothetical protein NJ7G_1398 [Natrinema sp. J7-2]